MSVLASYDGTHLSTSWKGHTYARLFLLLQCPQRDVLRCTETYEEFLLKLFYLK